MDSIIKIFLVDDCIEITDTYAEYLQNNLVDGKHNITKFYDSMACFEAIKQIHPQIIIMDNVMPKWDGIKLAEETLKLYTPILIIASATTRLEFVNHYHLFNYCVQKPVNLEQLCNVVSIAMNDVRIEKHRQIETRHKCEVEKNTICQLDKLDIRDKSKIFLKDIIITLLYDSDSLEGNTVYEKLSAKIGIAPNSIWKRIDVIKKRLFKSKPELFNGEIPHNKEFIDQLLQSIKNCERKDEKKNDERVG